MQAIARPNTQRGGVGMVEGHGLAVDRLKSVMCEVPTLKYFDPTIAVTVQCDASSTGLGAALLQDGCPVEYASHALTPTECQYAQIDKELLAIVFAMDRFHYYTYGRLVIVESDHKPLEIVVRKALHEAPKRLQRMFLRFKTV